MKKLILFMMVLAMATVATAGVEWVVSYDEGTSTAAVALTGTDVTQFTLALDAGAADIHADAPYPARKGRSISKPYFMALHFAAENIT